MLRTELINTLDNINHFKALHGVSVYGVAAFKRIDNVLNDTAVI